MATFNSSTFSTSNQYIKFRIRVTELEQDVVNSQTKVKVQIQAWRTNTGYTTYGNGTAYLYVGSRTFTQSITTDDKIKYNSYTTLLQVTINVPRGEAGDAATNMYARWNIGSSVTTDTEGYQFHLTPINRYALISEGVNFTDEGDPQITFINPAGTDLVTDLKARLKWTDSQGNQQATSYVNIPQADWAGGSLTFSLTTAQRDLLRSGCPNSNTLTVTYDLQSTMGGSDYHSEKQAVMTIVNASPVFSTAASYSDANSTVVGITGGLIVQKQSKLRIYHGTASAQKGASLINFPYSLIFNGATYTFLNDYIEFDKPDMAGTFSVVITATDSRGNISNSTFTFIIYSWSKPDYVYSIKRVNSFEDDTILRVDGKISDINGNLLTITERHKKVIDPDTEWSTAVAVPDDQDFHVNSPDGLDNTYEWEVEVTVRDSFSTGATTDTTVFVATVGKGIPLWFWDIWKNAIGFNCVPDAENQFKVNGHIKANNVIYPAVHSSTERIVGYWLNNEPIYERTVSLGSSQSIPSNSWTDLETLTYDIQILDLVAYYTSNAGNLVYNNLIGQFVNSSKKVQVLNTRSSAITIDTFKIQYIKITA